MGALLEMKAAPEFVLKRYLSNSGSLVFLSVAHVNGRTVVTRSSRRGLISDYGPRAIPVVLPFLVHQDERVRAAAGQGLVDLDEGAAGIEYLQRVIAEAPDSEQAARGRLVLQSLTRHQRERD